VRVVTNTTGVETAPPSRVFTGADILEIQQLVRQVVVAEQVARYAVRLVDASRPGRQSDHKFIRDWVKWGAGLRASQSLILAGQARALLNNRDHVSVGDIQALAKPVLRHRIIPNFYAESERITPDNLVERLLEAVPAPRSGM
jgi:MoxR-like ATPase